MYVCDMPIHKQPQQIPPKAIYKFHVFALDEDQMYDPNEPSKVYDICGDCMMRLQSTTATPPRARPKRASKPKQDPRMAKI